MSKCGIKKIQMPKFIKNELKSDSNLDSDDKEIMTKLTNLILILIMIQI